MDASSIQVLLIEDNEKYASLVSRMLDHEGQGLLKVTRAGTLKQGFGHLDQGQFHVILLDVKLPDSGGLETFTAVHARAPALPIVVLSGYDDEELALQAVRHGAQDYLVKRDVDGKLLLHVVRHAIERKRLEEEVRRRADEAGRTNEELRRREGVMGSLLEDLQTSKETLERSHVELQSTQLQLIQAEKLESVGRLAAGAAHEVKNPLATILMGINYLTKHLRTDNGREASILKDMHDAVKRADAVIRGLLDFSAPRTLELQSAALNDLVTRSTALVKHALDRAKVTIAEELAEGLPRVKVDTNKIEQVFVNLFMNAIHAMKDGGTLTVRTSRRELTDESPHVGEQKTDRFRAGETIVVAEVEDTGPGIPEGTLAKIFDPFYTTKPPGQGTGLGLSVSQKIVELHGGVLEITNHPSRGVRASLMLKAEP